MEMTELRSLGRRVAEYEDAILESAAPDDTVRRAVADRAGAGAKQRRPARVWVPIATAALALAAVAVLVVRGFPSEPPISFTVGQPPRSGALHEWVSAPDKNPIPVRFSEGSRVTLEPKARARVVDVSARGAEFVVESGRALVDIVPRRGNDWRVRTGPFVITVTGTRFGVNWNPQADEFALELYTGHVEIEGCAFGSGYAVKAGQRVQASCTGHRLTVSSLASAEGTPERPVDKSAEAPAPAEPAAPTLDPNVAQARELAPRAPGREPRAGQPAQRAATANLARGTPSWPELARQGHYREAYERAVARGFEAECERGGSEDVLLLGDAARLSGQLEQARQAYTAVRRRFAGSAGAARAAFDLGRLDAQSGREESAARWFETYLAEQPSGALASAALGRLLEARVRLGDTSRARATAATYLERYPAGPHADKAQEVLGSARVKD